MRVLFSFFILWLLSACASQQERAERFLDKNPTFLATQCATNFPPVIRYISGETKYDTIRTPVPGRILDCPEIIDSKGNRTVPQVKCPDYDIEKIIATRTDTIQAEYTDKLFLLQTKLATKTSEIARLDLEKEELEKQNTNKNFLILGLAVIILGLLFNKSRI